MLGSGQRAVAVALECLRHVGIDWSLHPSEEETRREYERIWSLLGNRAIEDVVDLPLMQDPEALATVDILAKLSSPAEYIDANLIALSICRATNLSLERGNNDAAPLSYAVMGLIASAHFGDHEKGYRLGKMACDLVDRRGLNRFGARAYNRFAVVVPWTRPLAEAIDPARRAFEMAKRHGEPAYAAFSCRSLISVFLALGHPLDQVEHEAEQGLEFVLPFGFFLDRMSAPLALVRTLRGKTTKFGSLDDGWFKERSFEDRATGQSVLAFLECHYWIRKLQARFFAGDYVVGGRCCREGGQLVRDVRAAIAPYAGEDGVSLLRSARLARHFANPRTPTAYDKHREALNDARARASELGGELSAEFRGSCSAGRAPRLPVSRNARSMPWTCTSAPSRRHAQTALSTTRRSPTSLAARFYAARGFGTIANAYLREARSCYLRWGADGKVRQLESLHPFLREPESAHAAAATIAVPIEHLDLATVLKVSQARLRRDGAGKTDRYADAPSDRARRCRTRPVALVARE